MRKNTLGLDLATNVSGYTILNPNGVILEAGVIDTSKKENIIEKSEVFKQWLTDQGIKDYIKSVGIENALTKMSFGSSANTLLKLTQFNILCQYHCYNYFGFFPIGINVRSARRKYHGSPIKRGTDQKELMLQEVVKKDPNIKQFLYPMKKDPNRYSQKSYDIIDSYVIAWMTQNE